MRGVNSVLHNFSEEGEENFEIHNPHGKHSIACGLDADLFVEIKGHVGFYCGGMNKSANITVNGHAGVGLTENMMSGMKVWTMLMALAEAKLEDFPQQAWNELEEV